MGFVTFPFALCVLPSSRSVKVVIDGTIDVGPDWNIQYNFKPISVLKPTEITPNIGYVLRNKEHFDTKLPKVRNELVTTHIIEDTDTNNGRAALFAQYESGDDKTNEFMAYHVTRLYNSNVKHEEMINNPHKIKHETEIMKFLQHTKSESLQMFDKVCEKLDKELSQKITELKETYAKKFGKFANETKDHTIKTTLGQKRVILNIVDYSNELLNRLVNRLKINIKNSGLRNGSQTTKTLKEHIDNLKMVTFEHVCKKFDICRTGNEFCDHISHAIGTLLKQDDASVTLATEATVKALKSANLSKIMDQETQSTFRDRLSKMEESDPFELRVLLMAFKLLIDNRHEPFQESDPENTLVKTTVVMLHLLEEFNRQIIIDTKHWNNFQKDFDRWLDGDKVDIKDVIGKLVDRIQKKIQALDKKSAKYFKDNLTQYRLGTSWRILLNNYAQNHPFII